MPSSPNVAGNMNQIIKGMYGYASAKVKFKNGKVNEVHLYPKNYVNLTDKYINKNKKNYIISPNSIMGWMGPGGQAHKNLAKNRYIMHKYWRTWVNNPKYFGTSSKIYKSVMDGKIAAFIAKSKKRPLTARYNTTTQRYVVIPTARNLAARLMERIRPVPERARKIKSALRYALNYEKAKKRSMSQMRGPTPAAKAAYLNALNTFAY